MNTLQNILDSGTRVKSERILASTIPMFQNQYDFSFGVEDQLDGTSVYLISGDVGLIVVQRTINWDYESNQPRYNIMKEKLAMVVSFYPIPLRSAVRPHFRFVLQALFESGILAIWRQKFVALTNPNRFSLIKPGGVNPNAEILKFADLIPAWFVVLSGLLVSSGVLLFEVVYVRHFGSVAHNLKKE